MIDNFFIFFLGIKDIIYYSLDILKMIIHSFVDKSIPHRSIASKLQFTIQISGSYDVENH